MPTDEELNHWYSSSQHNKNHPDPNSHDFINFSNDINRSRIKLLNEYIDFNSIKKIIDVGAGNANFGFILKKLYPNIIYDTIELDQSFINSYGPWVDDNFSDIDLVVNRYDFVVLNQVFEHIKDPCKYLKKISSLMKKNSNIYIDIPNKDFLFKPSLESHIMFWNKKSLELVLNKINCNIIFIDTAGMTFKQAKRYFNHQKFLQKVINPWSYANKINNFMKYIGLPKPFNTFQQFKANQYGGDRQWLRCIAQKNI